MQNSDNQNIMPFTAKINSANHLEIGGCDCVNLVKQYNTPLYVIDETTLRRIANQYKNAFSKYEKVNILFAGKALMTKAIAKILYDEGLGFDVVSFGEAYTAINAGVDANKILFNGSNKSYEELENAINEGIGRISVDNFHELKTLNHILKSKNKTQKVLLRITPGIECHTHEYIQTGHLDSKFGFDLTQIDEAIELTNKEYKNINLVGLHAHIGSQIFETQVYFDEVQVLCKEFRRIKDKFGIELSEMNLGGGLGVTYTKADTPPSIYKIADTIISSLQEGISKYNLAEPTIYIEPGRSIVATSGCTLYTIGSSKQVPNGKKYIAIDGGMADNPRPAMYQALYSAVVANKVESKNKETVTVAGRFCESGDILINNIDLPLTNAGDILCMFNTGAYCYSMSSNYNRVRKPTMILVNNEKSDIIILRESYDDLISHDIIPERLK